MFSVDFYQLHDGTKPVGQFIRSIEDQKLKAKVLRGLKLLETYGNKLREPDSKALEDGILKLRAIQGNNIARCLYFFMPGKKIIVTNGFIKKTDVTPPEELRLAKERKADHERRFCQ